MPSPRARFGVALVLPGRTSFSGDALFSIRSRIPRVGRCDKLTRVTRVLDVLAILLFLAAAVAFGFGLRALGNRQDFEAIYLLLVGGFALRASTELLRPRGSAA